MSDYLGDFLSSLGYGGAETGADITRMLDIKDPTVRRLSAQGLDPLFATVRTGLGELPELLATLQGQTQRRFQTGQAGLQQRGVELGRGGRAATARAGFAGGGAIQRRQRMGRRQLGQQFMGILGARETGMFGAEQRVAGERAGLLGQMGAGIQNLIQSLISGGVQFGAGGEPLSYRDWLERNPGGTVQEWGQYRIELGGPGTPPPVYDIPGGQEDLPESYAAWVLENPGGTYDDYVEFVESLGY